MFKIIWNIEWDTDGEDIELPSEVLVKIEENEYRRYPYGDIADRLSDEYGFCIFSFRMKEADDTLSDEEKETALLIA